MARKKPYKLSRSQRQRWFTYINALKRELPTAYPVAVRTCPVGKHDCGDSARIGKKFVVRICHRSTWLERVETLAHEYAHCLDWSHRHDRLDIEDHDDTWGLWYSRCYRVIEKYAEQFENIDV